MARNFLASSLQYLRRTTALGPLPVVTVPLTLHCLVRHTAQPLGNPWLVALTNAFDTGWFGLTNLNLGALRVQHQDGTNNGIASTTASMGNGVWYAATGVFASSTSRSVYLDGANKGTNSLACATPVSLDRLVIGAYNSDTGTSNCVDGAIAEVAIWNAALDDDEVAALGKHISPLLIRPASLVGYWPLLNSAAPDADHWRNGYHLFPGNAPTMADHPARFSPWRAAVALVEPPAASLSAASTIQIAATAALSTTAMLAAASALTFASAASLEVTGGRLLAASELHVGTSAALTATARLSAASALRFSSSGSFVPATMNGAAGFRFSTRATLEPGPRESIAGITIDGVDVRGRVRMKSTTIHDILNDAPNTCALRIEGEGPAVGQSLRITVNDGARVLFAGTVQTVDQSFAPKPEDVVWSVTAIDDTAKANAKRPFGTYVEVSASVIADALRTQCAPFFSGAGIAADLPAVSIVLDGADTFIAALARLATMIGGYCKVEDATIYLFITDTEAAPDPLDHTPKRFLLDPPIRASVDDSQLRTRVYGKGYGEAVQADIMPGEDLVPIEDGAQFPPLGGLAIVARTPDGAQSDRIAFAGVELAEGGTLVGPGAGPTVALQLGVTPGAGVDNGHHDLAVVFVTAAGKSLPGPFTGLDVPTLPPPPSAPAAGSALAGTGPDQGSHDYVAAFVTAFGETTPSPVSNAIATSAAVGQLAAPAAPGATIAAPVAPGNLPSSAFYEYRATFINATGETEGGAGVGVNGPGVPQPSPHAMLLQATTGGGLTPGAIYYYGYSYVCDNGYETMMAGTSSAGLGASQNAFTVRQQVGNPWQDGRPTKYRVYRSKAGGAGGLYYFLTERPLTLDPFTDTTPDSSLTVPAPSGPSGPDPGFRVELLVPLGPAGVTARKLYRSIGGTFNLVATLSNNTTTAYQDNSASVGAVMPASNTTGTAVQRIPVTNIPLGGFGVTARKLYRRFNGAGTFKLVTTLADNSTTAFTDAMANASLGAAALSTPTAVGNRIAVAGIPLGAATVTSRELYMSPVGSAVRRLALVIPNNTETTATVTASDATLGAAALEPVADTSGLQQPAGQVNPGAATIPVAAAATFRPAGGWVELQGGQVVRYTGISGQTLTGVPASGSGAITTTVVYGSPAVPAPMLTGVTGIGTALLKGSPLHIWVQRDDLLAQAEHAARTGGDGIVEYLLVDQRRGLESLTARCDAELALFARPVVTVTYATRDLKTKSGKQITIALDAPRITETLTIQEVTITEIGTGAGVAPRFEVQASSVRFSLEDTLRRLVSGGLISGGST